MQSLVQKKIVLLMSLCMLTAIAGLVYLRHSQMQAINVFYARAEKEFDAKAQPVNTPFESFVSDYSYWDDLVSFTKSRDGAWAQSAFAGSMNDYGTNALWVYSLDTTPLYAANNMGSSLGDLPLPKEALGKLFARSRYCHFFIDMPQGLLEIRGATIHPTDDSQRQTPPSGYLLAGRLWNDAYVRDLSEKTAFRVKLIQPQEKGVVLYTSRDDADAVTFTKSLQSWDGKPLMLASITTVAPLIGDFRAMMDRQFYTLSVCIFLSLIAFYFFIERWIAMPLRVLSESFGTDNPAELLKLQSDHSEFGRLATLLAQLFEQKSSLTKDLAHHKLNGDTLRKDNTRLAREVQDLNAKLFTPNESLQQELQESRKKNEDLAREIETIKQSEQALKESYAGVEQQFKKRTAELHAANELLQKEIIKEQKQQKAELVKALYERKLFERALAKAHAELEQRTAQLLSANTALEKEMASNVQPRGGVREMPPMECSSVTE